MLDLSTIPGDFIINPVMQVNRTFQSDFVLKAVRLRNAGAEPVGLVRIVLGLKVGSKTVREIVYAGEALKELMAAFPERTRDLQGFGASLLLGRERFWDLGRLATTVTLEPGQETGMMNEHVLALHSAAVDELEITVSYLERGQLEEVRRSIPLCQYRSQNQHTFPVRGLWQANGNYDCVFAHRFHYSMEFAFDLGQVDANAPPQDGRPLRDEEFSWFGKEVLAIGAGEVVTCFNDLDRQVRFSQDADERRKVWREREALIEEYGFLPQQVGNHVVIRHAGGECSLYGHLMHRSLRVGQGDTVEQGQIIGRIGNTGLSGCPHLHFQLMNGPDFLTSRGLPCHFTNIRNLDHTPLSLIQEEYTIVRAE